MSPFNKVGRGVVGKIIDASQDALLTLKVLFGYEKQMATRPETNVFVEEMRRKIAALPIASFQLGDETKQIPTLKFEISMPLISNESKLQLLTEAFERGMQKNSPASVTVSARARYIELAAASSCDEWIPPNRQRHYQVQLAQIIILTGCTSTPDNTKMLVEISQDEPLIVLRTRHSLEKDDQWIEFEQLLEKDAPSILSNEILTILPVNERRLKSLSIEFIDENPTTRVAARADGRLQTKLEFEYLGHAFASAVATLIKPLLSDLSFLYGGRADHNYMLGEQGNASITAASSIHLSTQVTAYFPLPDEMIEVETDEKNASTTKYISTDHMASWVETHFNQKRHTSAASTNSVNLRWALFVPSHLHTPLLVHDESRGGEGTSVTFALPTKGGEVKTAPLSGISLLNIDHLEYHSNDEEIDADKMQQHFQSVTSSALIYLVGYIRAVHGLSPMNYVGRSIAADVSVTYLSQSDMTRLSFWEMESIARNHWNVVLDKVVYETDALMSLLYTHSGLAFPPSVVHKLNNATHLLRHSISLMEQGYPTMYATSALYGSLHYLETVKSDPELMELPHFAFDHYLAVFSPLILPLLMPMIAGLVREIKRYRKLRNKIADEV